MKQRRIYFDALPQRGLIDITMRPIKKTSERPCELFFNPVTIRFFKKIFSQLLDSVLMVVVKTSVSYSARKSPKGVQLGLDLLTVKAVAYLLNYSVSLEVEDEPWFELLKCTLHTAFCWLRPKTKIFMKVYEWQSGALLFDCPFCMLLHIPCSVFLFLFHNAYAQRDPVQKVYISLQVKFPMFIQKLPFFGHIISLIRRDWQSEEVKRLLKYIQIL